METKKQIQYFISCGAIIYTCLSVLILIFSLAISEGASAKILVPSNFLYLLMFSYILSLGNTFLKATAMATPLRYTLHAVCYILAFFTFILLCGISFSSSCIMTLVYAIIYCGAMMIAHIVKKNFYSKTHSNKASIQHKSEPRKDKSKRDNTYKSMFS